MTTPKQVDSSTLIERTAHKTGTPEHSLYCVSSRYAFQQPHGSRADASGRLPALLTGLLPGFLPQFRKGLGDKGGEGVFPLQQVQAADGPQDHLPVPVPLFSGEIFKMMDPEQPLPLTAENIGIGVLHYLRRLHPHRLPGYHGVPVVFSSVWKSPRQV